MPSINIDVVNANELESVDVPVNGQSMIMVDRETNMGIILDYNKLANAILEKVMSSEMQTDGVKIYVIE